MPKPLVPQVPVSPKNDALAVVDRAALALIAADRQAAHAARTSKPRRPSTERLYAARWERWVRWCGLLRQPPAPTTGEVVATYLLGLAREGAGVASVELALAAVLDGQRRAGHEEPQRSDAFIRGALRHVRREADEAGIEVEKKKAITPDVLVKMIPHLRSAEERAVVLLAFWGSMRRAEVTAIKVESISFDETGATFRTPTKGRWETRNIPAFEADTSLCPVRALREVLDAHPLGEGWLFLNTRGRRLGGKEVNRMVKRAIAKAGLNASLYGAHSLRSGFMTSGSRAGIELHTLMTQSKHRSDHVAAGYVQQDKWKGNAALELMRRLSKP